MAIDIDTAGMPDREVGVQATLAVHMALLSALVVTHPDRPALKAKFEQLLSQLIERIEDPRFSAVLTTLESSFRTLF